MHVVAILGQADTLHECAMTTASVNHVGEPLISLEKRNAVHFESRLVFY